MLGEEIGTEGPIHIHVYSSVMLNPQPSYGKGQPEGTFEYNLKSMNSSVYEHVHHDFTVIP